MTGNGEESSPTPLPTSSAPSTKRETRTWCQMHLLGGAIANNKDLFAFSHADMPGIPKEIATHKLNVDPFYPPPRKANQTKVQLGNKRRCSWRGREVTNKRFHSKVQTALMDRQYSRVKKKNSKWRMCVEFTDLNKACPKDTFPLPHIDQLTDATNGHELLSFLDAYSGYNQILMEEEDQEKTTFITLLGTYCYRV